jgi:hypothetical protein
MRHLELALIARTQRSPHPAWHDENFESDLAGQLATLAALFIAFGTSSLLVLVVALVR